MGIVISIIIGKERNLVDKFQLNKAKLTANPHMAVAIASICEAKFRLPIVMR